ncbi:MAG: PP2C family protein-serine/threonine phosphatase [Actinomycetes bacterium]
MRPLPVTAHRDGGIVPAGAAAPDAAPTSGADVGGGPDVDRLAGRGVVPETVTRLLLVEDDDGDALLVEALLEESLLQTKLERARSVAEALPLLRDRFDCVLLDLGLPDAQGLDALHAVVAAADGAAVVCLTGLDAEERGIAAVGAGAQDYLVKGQVDRSSLRRAIQYAVERRRAEVQSRQLIARELQAAENARLERGLLPRPETSDPRLAVTTRYRPGRDAVLGGDFFDVFELDDGTLLAIIGDVTGHGPDEAALGVSLRIGWRTLVLSGVAPDRLFPALQELLVRERPATEIFTTACMVVVPPSRNSLELRLAGHHAPILLGGHPHQVQVEARGPMLGLHRDASWPVTEVALAGRWQLLLFTDGWIEGRVDGGPQRLGVSGLLGLITARDGDAEPANVGELIDRLLERVHELNGGPLSDDVAVVALEWDSSAPAETQR